MQHRFAAIYLAESLSQYKRDGCDGFSKRTFKS